MPYTFNSHLDVVMHTLEGNADRACDAAKGIIINAIQDKMLYGYSTPHGRDGHTEILDTGRLFDSITAEVSKDSQNTWTVTAGASSQAGRQEPVDYAVYVHEGTAKLAGRPFITDALTDETVQQSIEQAFVDDLKQGFE